jgi:5-enolpyruvylshikimate-3-phosphate synthase
MGRYGRGNASGLGNGDHYIGWTAANNGTVAAFAGVRYLASAGQWQCVIRAGGVDVAAQAIAVPADAAIHTFAVTNGGIANSVTCTIDSISRTVTASIPATTWFAAMGSTIASGSSYFTTIEARIHIARITR